MLSDFLSFFLLLLQTQSGKTASPNNNNAIV
jgi:hypothetical protein